MKNDHYFPETIPTQPLRVEKDNIRAFKNISIASH
jgi:hypothetical protein